MKIIPDFLRVDKLIKRLFVPKQEPQSKVNAGIEIFNETTLNEHLEMFTKTMFNDVINLPRTYEGWNGIKVDQATFEWELVQEIFNRHASQFIQMPWCKGLGLSKNPETGEYIIRITIDKSYPNQVDLPFELSGLEVRKG